MRNLNKNYSFVAGSRSITVTGDTFDIQDIRLIINETQKFIICSSMQKDLITSIVGSVITYSNALPVLVAGDKLTIEIDSEIGEGIGIINDYDNYRAKVAAATTLKGQNLANSDTADSAYNKIISITSNIYVEPAEQLNPYWHDLQYEVAMWADAENPYAFAILLEPSITEVFLSGATRYKLSDGRTFDSNSTQTFGANESGREDKLTKYVIFRTPTPYFSNSFGSYPNTTLNGRILSAYNYGNDLSAISFDGVRIGFIENDTTTKNPIVFGSDRKLLTLTTGQFRSTKISKFVFPAFADDATTSEKSNLVIPDYFMDGSAIYDIQFPVGLTTLTISGINAFQNCSSLTTLILPVELTTLTISGFSAFYQCTSLTTLIFPVGLTTLTISGGYAFSNCPSLTSLILPVGLTTLTISGINAFNGCNSLTTAYFPKSITYIYIQNLNTASALTKLEFENKWATTVNVPNTTLTAENTKLYILDRLADKRGDFTNATTATMLTTSPIVRFTNGNCLEIFRAGNTITLTGGTVRTILTVDNANQVTLTANGSHNLTNVAYDINRTLTLTSTVKALLVTAYGSTWADAYTAKGWTIA